MNMKITDNIVNYREISIKDDMIDPIVFRLKTFEFGKGSLSISAFCQQYSYSWDNTGYSTIEEFIVKIGDMYLTNKFGLPLCVDNKKTRNSVCRSVCNHFKKSTSKETRGKILKEISKCDFENISSWNDYFNHLECDGFSEYEDLCGCIVLKPRLQTEYIIKAFREGLIPFLNGDNNNDKKREVRYE